MRCPNCRSGIAPDHRFCAHCGTPLKRWAGNVPAGTTRDERKHVTILFADLIGSSRYLEDRDPEDARRLLLAVLDMMIDSVRGSGGIVNQVMGDGVMAMFGAPLADEHHALSACIAAVRMHETVARHAHETLPGAADGILLRVGIHTGEVVVGERGDGFDSQYTAFGEATHIAARLERLARAGATMISASTHALVRGQVLVEPLGPMTLRGLSRPVETFELRAVRIGHQRRRSSIGQDALVGREHELALVRARLNDAATGNGQVVVLHGEAGVGKSRLTAECAAEATQGGWLVIEAGATEHLRHIPYFPARDALKTYLLLGDEPSAWQGIISRRLQALDAPARTETAILGLFGISTPAWEALPAAARRQDIIDAVVWVVLAESRTQPVLWVTEDIQWADAETLALLARLAEAIRGAGVLLLLNHRPEYRTPLAEAPHCTRIEVQRLCESALDELLVRTLGRDASLLPLKVILAERTGGNPFFIEECVRGLLDAGRLAGALGDYQLVGKIENLIPSSVQGIIAARIDRLPQALKRMLQAAAVLGHRVDAEILRHLTGATTDDVEAGIDVLCGSGFLTPTMRFSGPGYGFVHALSQDVAYNSLLQQERQALHAKVVEIIESLYAGRLADHAEILGLHASAGRQWEKAVHHLRVAARKALSQSACEVALVHLGGAMQALDHLPDDRAHQQIAHDVRLERRNALFPLARHADMLSCLLEAEQIAIGLDDMARQARSAAHICHCYWLMGDSLNAVAAGRRALAMAEQASDVGLQVWARFFKALAHYARAEFPDAIALLQSNATVLQGSLSADRLGGYSLPAVVGGDWLSLCLAETGAFGQALASARAGLSVAERAGYPFDRVHGLIAVGGVHLLQGSLDEARTYLEQAGTLCETSRIVSLRPRVLGLLAQLEALSGNQEPALALSEQALRGGSRHGALRPICLRARVKALLLARRFTEAEQVAGELLELAENSAQPGVRAGALRLIGEAQARQHRPEAAANLNQALELADRLGMRPLMVHCLRALASLARDRGDVEESRRLAEQADTLRANLEMDGAFAPADLSPTHL